MRSVAAALLLATAGRGLALSGVSSPGLDGSAEEPGRWAALAEQQLRAVASRGGWAAAAARGLGPLAEGPAGDLRLAGAAEGLGWPAAAAGPAWPGQAEGRRPAALGLLWPEYELQLALSSRATESLALRAAALAAGLRSRPEGATGTAESNGAGEPGQGGAGAASGQPGKLSIVRIDDASQAPRRRPFRSTRRNIGAFPTNPPPELATSGKPPEGPTLYGGRAPQVIGLRVRKNIISASGRAFTVSNSTGDFVYATEGDFWSQHGRTRFYDARTGRLVALFVAGGAAQPGHEIYSYTPVCLEQAPESWQDKGRASVYRYARLARWVHVSYPAWTLSRYGCNGTLGPDFWKVKQVQSYAKYTVSQANDSSLVGTFGEVNTEMLTNNYDAWLASGEDVALFSSTVVLVGLERWGDGEQPAGRGGVLGLLLILVTAGAVGVACAAWRLPAFRQNIMHA